MSTARSRRRGAGGRVPPSAGFPPIADPRATILILGSLPGQKSLEMSQYYAQPQNGFWKIMDALFGAGPSLPYAARLERLIERRVAVWDVLAAGERPGSLDSAIVASSAVSNDFAEFFDRHREIRRVCFNGTKARDLYLRMVLPKLAAPLAALDMRLLPSTSPAHASLRFAAKLERWSAALASAPGDPVAVPRGPSIASADERGRYAGERRAVRQRRRVPRRGA